MTIATRWQTFFHALAFVLGFSLVFVTLGAAVAFVGYALDQLLPFFVKIGGMILILFGLQVAGVLGWIAGRVRRSGGDRTPLGRSYLAFVDGLNRLLYSEGRVHAPADRSLGYLSSALMGVFFSAGWIPCIGPVLAAIYLLASDTQTVGQGALLLLVYSAGLGIPFLLTGAAFSTMTGWLRRLNRRLGLVAVITGLFLIFIGVLLFLNQLPMISAWIVSRLGTGLASVELGGAGSSSVVTAPLAFVAGLLSFLSPCVLPLIPAYIGYLGGTAVGDKVTR
jgi:cytochrome c-type biogenesis protein